MFRGTVSNPPNAKSKLKNIQNISMDYKIPKYLGGQWITPQMPKANGLQNLCNNKLHKGIKNYTTPSVPLCPKIQVILEILGQIY